MKVFIVTNEWQYDSGEEGTEVRAFSTKEKAKKHFDQQVGYAKDSFEECSYDSIDEELCDDSFSIWESDNYCFNHMNVTIDELTVDEEG